MKNLFISYTPHTQCFFTEKKKLNQFFGMNSFTLEYQAYTFRTIQHRQQYFTHEILPQNKAHIINQTFFISNTINCTIYGYQQNSSYVSTIHITHRFNHLYSVDFILASTAAEASPNSSRIQLNFTGGSSVLNTRISAIFFLQFLGRKLKVF